MGKHINDFPVLYSVGTKLAYQINKRYYNDIHYVWCAGEFHSSSQPPTSNPRTIIKRYLEQVTSGDRHATEITNNIAGILKGAKAKRDAGVITQKQYLEIRSAVSAATYEAFFPVLYIIQTNKVLGKYTEVPIDDRASDKSYEYKISSLERDEFHIIDFEQLLSDLVTGVDKKVGV